MPATFLLPRRVADGSGGPKGSGGGGGVGGSCDFDIGFFEELDFECLDVDPKISMKVSMTQKQRMIFEYGDVVR